MSTIKDGGPAFPVFNAAGQCAVFSGMSLRDWFATHAPDPTQEQINMQRGYDHSRNPYNDSHKPRLRSTFEIIGDLKYQYADGMIAAREKDGDQ